LPPVKPQRPSGRERDIVVTTWDYGDDKHYLHDEIATDKRNPTVNAYGPIFGSPEYSTDNLPIVDPVKDTATTFHAPVRDKDMPESLGYPGDAAALKPLAPSAYWGNEQIWDNHINNHNSMFDGKGRLWLAAAVRGVKDPAFCGKNSDLVSAKLFPLSASHRQLAMLDPKTMKYTFVDTCFQTHHLQFGFDNNDTLWTSSGGGVGDGRDAQAVGWLNTKKFLETGDAAHSQGWTALIVDTAGTGKREGVSYTEPGEPLQGGKDMRIGGAFYAIMPSPVDGTVWGTLQATGPDQPGAVVRIDPGPNPPATALSEIYRVPFPAFGPRGGDIDSKGVVWVSLASGHLGRFDRSKCKGPLNGPKATGNQCPEGWSFYKYPGPGFAGIGDNSAESSYYTWVDQHNTLGLGSDVPVSTGNLNDGLIAFVGGKMIVMKVPYPTGFYAKGLDGRIDDPKAGWKGRGLWTTNGDRVPWHQEGGKGMTPMVVHIQMRPNPLAD
jgi:hypothetical protein